MAQMRMDEEEFYNSVEAYPLESSNSETELGDEQTQLPEPTLTQQLAQPVIQPTVNTPVNMQWPLFNMTFGQDQQSQSLMLPSQPPSQTNVTMPSTYTITTNNTSAINATSTTYRRSSISSA